MKLTKTGRNVKLSRPYQQDVIFDECEIGESSVFFFKDAKGNGYIDGQEAKDFKELLFTKKWAEKVVNAYL